MRDGGLSVNQKPHIRVWNCKVTNLLMLLKETEMPNLWMMPLCYGLPIFMLSPLWDPIFLSS